MDEEFEEINYKFDTQLLLEGKDLSDDKVRDYITQVINYAHLL